MTIHSTTIHPMYDISFDGYSFGNNSFDDNSFNNNSFDNNSFNNNSFDNNSFNNNSFDDNSFFDISILKHFRPFASRRFTIRNISIKTIQKQWPRACLALYVMSDPSFLAGRMV
jgi:hypothetical protein